MLPAHPSDSQGHYWTILPQETRARAADYLIALQAKTAKPGSHLQRQLHNTQLSAMGELDLLGRLCDTKQPQIFAEMAVVGDGSDWNRTELSLLGDLSIAVPVTIFDDGHHSTPKVHLPPFAGVLIFTPGALLRNGQDQTPADWDDVVHPNGQLSAEGYYRLYRRRLLPVLQAINAYAGKARSAFVTVPGLGCGQFAGRFRGQLGQQLQAVLERLLGECGASLPNLKAVYFDPYREGRNERQEIHGISLLVRPLGVAGNGSKPQLCRPAHYAEDNDDFADCLLCSIVAWDPVSWPGNDFYLGSRSTDDGVKAAATNAMAVITGIEGSYNSECCHYQPPAPYSTWEEVVHDRQRQHHLRLWRPPQVVVSACR
jgi:hypothetical protein